MKLFSAVSSKQYNGFTLIEFIVIMMIFAVMVGVALFNFNGFRSAVTLDNLAHDIGISIRQIQSSAGSALSSQNGGATAEIPRGIYFRDDNGVFAKEFILFEDTTDNDGIYTEGSDKEIDIIKIQTADYISEITYKIGADEPLPISPADGLGITFKRYKTDAMFASLNTDVSGASEVKITISSPSADGNTQTRSITISRIGQVSIQ
jgi:type II secretory pathway pseudopilin PulG